MISKYINNIKKVAQPDNCIIDEIAQINIHRVFYLSIISIPMRLITIINFIYKSTAGDEKEIKWQIGIIISHMVFLVLLIILGSISYKLRKKNKPNSMTFAVIYAMVITMLLISVIITSIDQLVTYNITPFIIACVAIGPYF